MNTPPGQTSFHPRRPWGLSILLVLSLLANVFLGILLYLAARPLGVPPAPPPSASSETAVKTNIVVRRENFTWDQVESTNYTVFIQNLRAIGCPEPTIRDIIMSDVNHIFERRRLDEVAYPNFQWWRSTPDPAVVQAATDKLALLEKERRQVLTSLLGAGWAAEGNQIIAARAGVTLTGPILGDMAPESKEQIYALIARAQLKVEAYQQTQGDQSKPIDPMEVVRLREEPFGQVVGMMNPEQYEEFILRYSPSAQQLREQMRQTDVTQAQFRSLFDAVSSINGQPMFYYAGNDPALISQRQQLRAQCDAVIKATLGDQFYAAYQLNQDPLYRSSKAMADQLGVPDATVTPIYEISRATQAELERIRKDTNMSNDEKVEAMSQTQVEQQQTLEQILGPEAFQRWLESHAGFH